MKDYILASLNLYGLISINDLFNILKNYIKDIDKNDLINEVLKLTNDLNYDISYYNDILYSEYFNINNKDDLNDANLILLESKKLNYYLPNEKEFLKYSNQFFIEESNSLNELILFIKNNNIYNENYKGELKKILNNFYTKDGLSYNFLDYINYLENIGFNFKNKSLINKFNKLLTNLKYDIRLFQNKGYTINELIDLNLYNDLVDIELYNLLINSLNNINILKVDDLKNKYYLKYNTLLTNKDIYILKKYLKNNNKTIKYKNDCFIKK